MEGATMGLLTDLEEAVENLTKEVKKLQTKIDALTEEIGRLRRKP